MSDNIVNPDIFKAYDIRGIYPTDLNAEIAFRIGRAYAGLIQSENPGKQLEIVVARDMRLSSDELRDALVNGLTDSGVNVTDIGLASTPTFYFAAGYLGLDGGVQVSASHNPKEYNGFKMVRAKAVPVSGDSGIFEIRDMVIKNKWEKTTTKGSVSTYKNIVDTTVMELKKNLELDLIKPMTIVVDAANAMGAPDVEAMMEGLPINLVKLNFELDGSFPVHEPDPLKDENLKILQDAVIEHKADLGLAPDGDGDRYFLIDEKGNIVRQEILRGIMAQIELKDNLGEVVCYDIRPGRITKDMIEEAGGKAIVTKVGHSLIKEHMIKENAVFGGESSGHYFYRTPWGTFEVPVFMILKFLIWMSRQNKPLSESLKPYQKYFHSGEINSVVEDKVEVFEKLKKTYADAEINELDGVTIEYPDFWFNVRGSNTEPKIRLNLEAVSQKIMEDKRDEVLDIIRG